MQTNVKIITSAVFETLLPHVSKGQLNKLRPDVEAAIKKALGGREVIELSTATVRQKLIQEAR